MICLTLFPGLLPGPGEKSFITEPGCCCRVLAGCGMRCSEQGGGAHGRIWISTPSGIGKPFPARRTLVQGRAECLEHGELHCAGRKSCRCVCVFSGLCCGRTLADCSALRALPGLCSVWWGFGLKGSSWVISLCWPQAHPLATVRCYKLQFAPSPLKNWLTARK